MRNCRTLGPIFASVLQAWFPRDALFSAAAVSQQTSGTSAQGMVSFAEVGNGANGSAPSGRCCDTRGVASGQRMGTGMLSFRPCGLRVRSGASGLLEEWLSGDRPNGGDGLCTNLYPGVDLCEGVPASSPLA